MPRSLLVDRPAIGVAMSRSTVKNWPIGPDLRQLGLGESVESGLQRQLEATWAS